MMSTARIAFALFVVFTMTLLIVSAASPFERAVGVCIRNCAQCKKMYGPYFLGEKCADFCVKYKGKFVPDCEDELSIQPFLHALDANDPKLTDSNGVCLINCGHCKRKYAVNFNDEKCYNYCTSSRPAKVIPNCSDLDTVVWFLSKATSIERKQGEDICLTNCIQCKEIFESYFYLGQCASYCVSERNITMPDCNDASTIQQFIHSSQHGENSLEVPETIDQHVSSTSHRSTIPLLICVLVFETI